VCHRPAGREITATEWRRYLYVRQNLAGWTSETWFHQAGCRRFLVVERHTVTNEIRAVRSPPAETGAADGNGQ
jgi:heterotetrameric sarcosine oxidase delta subunit